MSLPLVVLLCGVAAAVLAFATSASRRIQVDPVDPSAEQQAVRRSLWRHPRVRRFLKERMDRRTAGGFLLTASIVVLFAVAMVVGVVLDMIDNNSGLAAADKSVAEWGSRNADTGTAHAMKWITQFGSTTVVFLALLITASVDYFRRRTREVFVFVAAVGLGELLLNNLLKLIVHRERPSVLRLVTAHGYSFPSGHTVAAASCWAAIALVLGRDRPRIVRAPGRWGRADCHLGRHQSCVARCSLVDRRDCRARNGVGMVHDRGHHLRRPRSATRRPGLRPCTGRVSSRRNASTIRGCTRSVGGCADDERAGPNLELELLRLALHATIEFERALAVELDRDLGALADLCTARPLLLAENGRQHQVGPFAYARGRDYGDVQATVGRACIGERLDPTLQRTRVADAARNSPGPRRTSRHRRSSSASNIFRLRVSRTAAPT